jgi:hypothetical protein
VGNSLYLQPNKHSVSKGTGLLKNTLSTPNHVPAMYNLAGTRLYVDPDLPSEVQDKVTSCYMLMITAYTFSYVKCCYYTWVSLHNSYDPEKNAQLEDPWNSLRNTDRVY